MTTEELSRTDELPDQEEPVRNVHWHMNRVMSEIGAIAKDRTGPSDQGSYAFRGIDQFMNRLHPIMARHHVYVVPTVVNSRYEFHETTNKAGARRITTHAILSVRFCFYGPEGDFVMAVGMGEGLDTSDKATNKAMSAALKYVLMQTFMVPTADIAESDLESPQLESEGGGGFDGAMTEAQLYWRGFGWPASTNDEALGHNAAVRDLSDRIKRLGSEGARVGAATMAGAGRKWPPDPTQFDAITKGLDQVEAQLKAAADKAEAEALRTAQDAAADTQGG